MFSIKTPDSVSNFGVQFHLKTSPCLVPVYYGCWFEIKILVSTQPILLFVCFLYRGCMNLSSVLENSTRVSKFQLWCHMRMYHAVAQLHCRTTIWMKRALLQFRLTAVTYWNSWVQNRYTWEHYYNTLCSAYGNFWPWDNFKAKLLCDQPCWNLLKKNVCGYDAWAFYRLFTYVATADPTQAATHF